MKLPPLFPAPFFDDAKHDTPHSSSTKIFSVSEINLLVREHLETLFPTILVAGEISNAILHSSGHFYFTLKDEHAQLRAVMFSNAYRTLRFVPENGTHVIVRGKLTCFVKGGSYQINCVSIDPQGKGALQLAFEQLKAKLEKEGLFDAAHKRPISMIPQRIGIVTSPTGAAIRDILTVIRRRYANVEILLYPVRVQGDTAHHEISAGIEYLNAHHPDLDVLLVGRGGGSVEDLWAFNEEIVARAMYHSRIPVISCVGHETDVVIADFVADLRAPTPSAAAELVVQNKHDIEDRMTHFRALLVARMRSCLEHAKARYARAVHTRIMRTPHLLIDERTQQLDYLVEKMQHSLTTLLDKRAYRCGVLTHKLHALSPKKLLARGYSVVTHADTEALITSIHEIKPQDMIAVHFVDGKAVCEVKHKI